MNWNGQRPWVDHWAERRINPATAAAKQDELNNRRRKRYADALYVRPIFLPLQWSMTAAAQTSPYRDSTPSLGYDVLVTGGKSDAQTRDIIIRSAESETSITRIGDESSLYLRADEMFGQAAANAAGQLGTFYFPAPIPINRGQRITGEMFKTDATDDPEVRNAVFTGIRIFEHANISPDDQALINRYIAMREVPRPVFLKVKVDFDSAGAGGEARNLFTPQVEEPLLIRGIRTSLRQSTIELGISGEPTWTVEPTPIWAVAAEDELIHDNYQWFSRPVPLAPNGTVEIRKVVNSIDGSLTDTQTGNYITFLCETV
jgi:hypothetical protein